MKDELKEIAEQLQKLAERLNEIVHNEAKSAKENDTTPQDPGDHHPH